MMPKGVEHFTTTRQPRASLFGDSFHDADNCAHNGGVYGSQTYDNANQQWIGSMAQYWQGPNGKIVSTEQAAADVDGTNLSPALAKSNVAVASGTDASGNPTNVVTITYTFNTIVGFPGIPSAGVAYLLMMLLGRWMPEIGHAAAMAIACLFVTLIELGLIAMLVRRFTPSAILTEAAAVLTTNVAGYTMVALLVLDGGS